MTDDLSNDPTDVPASDPAPGTDLVRAGWGPRVASADGPQITAAPVVEDGADLAAHQRAAAVQRSNRQRAKVVAQQQAERQAHKEQLARKAARAQRQRRIRAVLTSPRVAGSVVAVFAVGAGFAFGVPAVKRLLHPPLTEQQLRAELATLDLDATEALQVSVTDPQVVASADASSFAVTYTVKARTKNLRAKKVKGACSISFAVDAVKSRPGKLDYERKTLVPCKTAK